MRPLILITVLVLLASCRSNRQLQTESLEQSAIDTQTSSGTRITEQVHDLYSDATTIELTDITIGLRQQAQADTETPPANDFCPGSKFQRGEWSSIRASPSSIHIGKATITNNTTAEKHIAATSDTEDTASHHADKSAESKQQSKSEIKAQTTTITFSFWILTGALLILGYLYVRRLKPK